MDRLTMVEVPAKAMFDAFAKGKPAGKYELDEMRFNEFQAGWNAALDFVNEHANKDPETKPMYDREGNYVGEWNGKISTGEQYQSKRIQAMESIQNTVIPTRTIIHRDGCGFGDCGCPSKTQDN